MKINMELPRFKVNKEGFTLIEAVLVIAIIVIIIPMILATFIIIRDSHESVSYINDAKSFAYLNQRAIDNLLVNAEAAKTTGGTSAESDFPNILYVADGNKLMLNGSQVFDYNHYASSGSDKWRLELNFTAHSDRRSIEYTIRVIDNDTGDQYYVLRTASYLPNASTSDVVAGEGSTAILFRTVSTT